MRLKPRSVRKKPLASHDSLVKELEECQKLLVDRKMHDQTHSNSAVIFGIAVATMS